MITHGEIKAAGANDVGDWGEKDVRGVYSSPLRIAGEVVEVENLPWFGDIDRTAPASEDAEEEDGAQLG